MAKAEIGNAPETIKLEEEYELLLKVCEPGFKSTIRLITGSAEIFGSELQENKDYEFTYFSSVAVFTWNGCTLQLRSNGSKHRIRRSWQTPTMKDLHKRLKEKRTLANKYNTGCPITLVTGPTDVGKSTLCRFLLNYAARETETPIFVDLDVGQSSFSIPGTVGMLPVNGPSDVFGKFDESDLCIYYFGYKSPGMNRIAYQLILEKIGRRLTTRKNKQSVSEILIDTCGWVDKVGYELIKDIVYSLDVNTILVLSKHKLYLNLRNDLSSSTEIIFVDKFRDVAFRSRTARKNYRAASVREYFYGPSNELQPCTIKVNFGDLKIFKADFDKTNNIAAISIQPRILNQVFGLSYAECTENILVTSIYGFVSIVELDMDSKVATILSPRPGPLPTNHLLMGDMTLTC